MMRALAGACLSLLVLAAAAHASTPRGVVVVAVAEDGTGAPIAGAQVYFPELRLAKWTDWLGEARFDDVPQGTHRVRVRRIGYAPSETRLIVGRETVGPVFMLERLPPTLDTVRTRAPFMPSDVNLLRMEWRRQLGIGRFIADSVLLAHRSDDIPFLVQTRLPGLSARSSTLGSMVHFASRRGCPVSVYLDDLLITPAVLPNDPGTPYWDIFPISGPADLAGIEYYQDGAVPPQYRRLAQMGGVNKASMPCMAVVLLWSRWR